jgi:hypothetical protein
MAKNQHRNLTGDALHNPKGFDGASNGTKPVKDATGALDWITETQLPKALDYVSAQSAPPTEVTGDVYLIDTTGTAYDINTIAWQSGNTIRIAFNGSPDLSAVAADDYFITSGNGNASNDGTFIITTVNDGSDYIEITNNDRSDATDDEATDAVGTGYYTLAEWDAVSKVSHVTFDGSIWSSITPSEGQSCYDVALGAIRVFDGTDWSSSLASGGVTGSGTTNYLARWTPSGSALGNSVVQDDGTQVHVGGTPTSSTMLKVTPVDKYGIYVDSDQNTTSVISAYIADIANTGTGNIEAIYSTSAGSNDASANVSLFHSNGVTAGTQANSYGLYLTAHTAGTAKWGIYQAGANDKNYFAGAMQFDTASAATGYVWTATDADGNGDWAAASGGGGSSFFEETTSSIKIDNTATTRDILEVSSGSGSTLGGTFSAGALIVGSTHTASGGGRRFIMSGLSNTASSNFIEGGIISGNANTYTSGNYSHTFGDSNIMNGNTSFITGSSNTVNGDNCFVAGNDNITNNNDQAMLGWNQELQSGVQHQIAIGQSQHLTSNHNNKGIFFAMGSARPNISMVNGDTHLAMNMAMGSYNSGRTLDGAGMTGTGGGVFYFMNGQVVEPTVNLGDATGIYGKDRAATKSGIIIKAEDGTKHFLGDFSAIGGDETDAEANKTLTVKGTGTGSGTSSLKTTDSGGNATFEVLDNGTAKSGGQIGSSAGATPNTETPSGTTETIDWDNGNYQVLDLESASDNVTLTLSNPVAGFAYFIEIRQDSTTPLDVIFPSSVKFAGETAPYTLDVSTGANAVDAVSLAWNGSEYIASFSQNHG